MTTTVDIVNRGLQVLGTRTTVTAAELLASSSNEAIQANLILENTRDDTLRMAPWNCATTFANLTYITSLPGTPENTSPYTTLWQPGQPRPPFVYEFQYPVDCLRPCWVVPQSQQGIVGSIPIYPVSTGFSPSSYNGPAVLYKVVIDQFYPITVAAVNDGGQNYDPGDVITLASGVAGAVPIGAPVQLRVLTTLDGAVLTVEVITQINGSATPLGGSYFARQPNPVAQGSIASNDGVAAIGSGATFNLTYGAQVDQRVIVTNQEFPILAYVKQVTDPNVMDTSFQSAWSDILGAKLCMALTGDKTLANMAVGRANATISQARKADGNEGLTVNDVTPDFIRARGLTGYEFGGVSGFDWGPLYPLW